MSDRLSLPYKHIHVEKDYPQSPHLDCVLDKIYEPWAKLKILFIDTETTDMLPKVKLSKDTFDTKHQMDQYLEEKTSLLNSMVDAWDIVQIHCALYENRIPTKVLSTLLYTDNEISDSASKVHGITKDHLKGMPKFADIVPEFRELVRECDLICAYNANFDRNILNKSIHYNFLHQDQKFVYAAEGNYLESDYINRPHLDPLVWRRHERGSFTKNKLYDAARDYAAQGISDVAYGITSLHNAATDVSLLADLTYKMLEKGDIPFHFGHTILHQDKLSRRYFEHFDKK